MIAIYRRLTEAQIDAAVEKIEAWFKLAPRRKACRTDIYGGIVVRRGHVREDILAERRKG